jgi:hypothetical protein
MKKLLIILPLLFSGCFGVYKFKPVSEMTDSQLQQEHLDIQSKIGMKQVQSDFGFRYIAPQKPTSYTTTGSARTYGNISRTSPYGGYYSGTTYLNAQTRPNYGGKDAAAGRAVGIMLSRLIGVSAVMDIHKLETRLNTLALELSRRGYYH